MRITASLLLLLTLFHTTNSQTKETGSEVIQIEGQSPDQCQDIKGLGPPVFIFHTYFRQTISIFNPKQPKTEIKLLYYREERTTVQIHRFVFRMKGVIVKRFEYIGILSVVPAKEIKKGTFKHFVVRYINSSDLQDVVALLGIYEADKDLIIPCPKMKKTWVEEILRDPYVITTCEPEAVSDCITSQDLTKLFSATFSLLEHVLASFGFDVSSSQLGYDETILDIYLKSFKKFDFIIVSLRYWIISC